MCRHVEWLIGCYSQRNTAMLGYEEAVAGLRKGLRADGSPLHDEALAKFDMSVEEDDALLSPPTRRHRTSASAAAAKQAPPSLPPRTLMAITYRRLIKRVLQRTQQMAKAHWATRRNNVQQQARARRRGAQTWGPSRGGRPGGRASPPTRPHPLKRAPPDQGR